MNKRKNKLNEWELTRARFHISDRFPPRPLRKEKGIETILSDIMEEQQADPEIPAELMERWHLIAGIQIAKHTELSVIKNGTLIVFVDHPGWLTEVRRFPQARLLKKITAINGLPPIQKIRFQLNPSAKTWRNKT